MNLYYLVLLHWPGIHRIHQVFDPYGFRRSAKIPAFSGSEAKKANTIFQIFHFSNTLPLFFHSFIFPWVNAHWWSNHIFSSRLYNLMHHWALSPSSQPIFFFFRNITKVLRMTEHWLCASLILTQQRWWGSRHLCVVHGNRRRCVSEWDAG